MTDPRAKPPESALRDNPGVSGAELGAGPRPGKRRRLSIGDSVKGVLARDPVVIGQTLTLMESSLEEHRVQAEEVLSQLMPHTGGAVRLGISGAPGVGKSTFIETFGLWLLERGHRLAVLAVDPSSEISGGSVLGDKTRMEGLARAENALVRPSPSGDHLGGVARRTRESILLCEAAGFDVIIVETVGVGQSETQVASMVDFFLLLLIAGAGDELQGIKRGIVELADAIAINKADGDNLSRALRARQQIDSALTLLRPPTEGWKPPALTCSGATGHGIEEIWKSVTEHRALLMEDGRLEARRRHQAQRWFDEAVDDILRARFLQAPGVRAGLEEMRAAVLAGRRSAHEAARAAVECGFTLQGTSSQSSSPPPRGDQTTKSHRESEEDRP